MLGILCLTVLTVACSTDESGENGSSNSTPQITRYITQTPTTAALDGSNGPEPTSIPLPAATPFLYIVAANDTLIGIAIRYNIPLDALIASNPGLDPNFLSIGAELNIPVQEGSIVAELPSPTPVSLALSDPRCYMTASGGVWCFLLVENEQSSAMENLAALISLYSSDGSLTASQEAVALLNILPSGQRIPLVTFFEGPLPSLTTASGQILSAISISSEDSRYLPAAIEHVQTVIESSGNSAHIQGQLILPAESQPANLVWVVAVAYDEDGYPVGVRRWEHFSEILAGSVTDFVIEIFSLGAAIDSVELLYEVRP